MIFGKRRREEMWRRRTYSRCCRLAKRGDNSLLWKKSLPSHHFINRYYIDTGVQKEAKSDAEVNPVYKGQKKKQKVTL